MTSPLHLPLKLPCISVAPLMQLLRISRAPLSPIPSIGVAPPFAGDALQRLGSFAAKSTTGNSDHISVLATDFLKHLGCKVSYFSSIISAIVVIFTAR